MPAPTGTVTFLFTDIQGSTGLLQALGETYVSVQERHCEIIRTAVTAEGGHVVRTEGDSFFVTFVDPRSAVRAAVAAQRNLSETDWPEGVELRVRMGLHTGQGVLSGDDYIGIDVNTAARIAGLAHGGQVLVSDATRTLVKHDLPDGVTLRDLGEHRLRDIAYPEHLFDLVIDGLPSDFPAIRSLDVRPNNLPMQLTSFVGRADEIAQAVQLLTEHRLVTLTGPGGSGKTRLALAVAREVLPRFEDGVFFVDLAPLSDHAQVPSVIAQALAIREQKGRPLIDTLVDGLAATDVLLVLDNFEHVLSGAWIADRLLKAAPKLQILVTSRAPLRLYGEQELPVPPLALPDLSDADEPMVLSRYEAIALFTERARAASPGFVLSDDNARLVADMCARLDGLPLAIELAASRIKVLTPQAILSRLGGLDLLTATTRNLPPRQRTLRATVTWSYSLLEEPEQRLFARLSVFRGGAGLEAVDAGRADLLEARSARVTDVFAIGYAASDGVPISGSGSLNTEAEWRIGRGNIELLHDAINRFEALGDVAGVAKAKGGMALFLGGLGHHQSAIPLLEQAIAGYREVHERFHLVHALAAYAQGQHQLGDPAAGRAAIVEALGIVDEADNSLATAVVLEILSGLESAQGQHERAVRLLESGREIQRKLEGGLAVAATDVVGVDVLADARQAIGDEAVDRALAEGRSMSRAEAVAYAAESE